MQLQTTYYLLLLWAGASCVLGNSAGPPVATNPTLCDTLMPSAADHGPASVGTVAGGYIITTDMPLNADNTAFEFEADQVYTVNLTGRINPFRGFAIQSVMVPGDEPLGTFTPQGANQQILTECTPSGYTVAHSNSDSTDFSNMMFSWNAPSSPGSVNFLYTVVQSNPGDYYVKRSAVSEFVSSQVPNPTEATTTDEATTDEAPTDEATTNLEDTMPPTDMGLPAGVTMPSTAAADYPLVFKSPSSCNVTDCTVYVGIEGNEGDSDYLNFYIEGDAVAWVAVGFSPTPNMPDADVFACNRVDGGEEVEVLDTWNVMGPTRNNDNDDVMDTFMFSSSVVNGRIICSFGRSIAGSGDEQQDFDLDGDYYVLFGVSDGATSSGVLVFHGSPNPSVTGEQFNIVRDSGVGGAGAFESVRRALIRAHGIFMLIAWFLLVNVGVHFAWYMRCPLPNGEWFQVHRATMIVALFISVIGVIFAFISQARSSIPGLIDLSDGTRRAHFAIGLCIILIQIVNPIIAIFRCHPGEKYRWVFNVIHGKIFGQWGSILGLTNVGLGLSLFSTSFSQFGDLTLLWIFIGYIVFNLLMHVVLITLSCTICRGEKSCNKCDNKCDSKKTDAVEMNKQDETVTMTEKEKMAEADSEEKERKEPPKGSIYIWIAMGINIAVIAILSFVFLVLIALPM